MHATAIEDATEAVDVAAQLQPGRNFGAAGVGLAAVGEHVEVERIAQPGPLDRVVGRADTGEHAWHVLIADRAAERGVASGRPWRVGGGAEGRRVGEEWVR